MKFKNFGTKILSIVLAVSLMPVVAFANDENANALETDQAGIVVK